MIAANAPAPAPRCTHVEKTGAIRASTPALNVSTSMTPPSSQKQTTTGTQKKPQTHALTIISRTVIATQGTTTKHAVRRYCLRLVFALSAVLSLLRTIRAQLTSGSPPDGVGNTKAEVSC